MPLAPRPPRLHPSPTPRAELAQGSKAAGNPAGTRAELALNSPGLARSSHGAPSELAQNSNRNSARTPPDLQRSTPPGSTRTPPEVAPNSTENSTEHPPGHIGTTLELLRNCFGPCATLARNSIGTSTGQSRTPQIARPRPPATHPRRAVAPERSARIHARARGRRTRTHATRLSANTCCMRFERVCECWCAWSAVTQLVPGQL